MLGSKVKIMHVIDPVTGNRQPVVLAEVQDDFVTVSVVGVEGVIKIAKGTILCVVEGAVTDAITTRGFSGGADR